MQEAQEMFKNANKVTRPEKALILGFMAGSRGNLCLNRGIERKEKYEFFFWSF
jgi:negative elongation factor A